MSYSCGGAPVKKACEATAAQATAQLQRKPHLDLIVVYKDFGQELLGHHRLWVVPLRDETQDLLARGRHETGGR